MKGGFLMRFFKQSFTSLKRKKGKTLLLLVLSFTLTILVITGVSIRRWWTCCI